MRSGAGKLRLRKELHYAIAWIYLDLIDNHVSNDMGNLMKEISAEITNSFKLHLNNKHKLWKINYDILATILIERFHIV